MHINLQPLVSCIQIKKPRLTALPTDLDRVPKKFTLCVCVCVCERERERERERLQGLNTTLEKEKHKSDKDRREALQGEEVAGAEDCG